MGTNKGFSLIELLVAVAIIAILAAVAIPSYRSHILKSQRSDGKVAIMESAQRLERYYTNNNTYAGATVGNADTDTIQATSEEGFYTLSLPVLTAGNYTIQATRVGGNDPECATMNATHTGAKTPAECW
ncbi:MAG: type IV pilin protein [Desulfovibrionales bacterium]